MWVPFPFVEAPRLRDRPALIVSRSYRGDGFRLYWAVMVTSLANAGWPDDIMIGENFADAGLPAPSVIRPAKIATVMEGAARLMGKLPMPVVRQVRATIKRTMSLDDEQ